MNDKGSINRDRVFIPVSERLLMVSLGLLMTGLAQGATENILAEDCRTLSGGKGISSEQGVKCAPVGSEDEAGDKSSLYQDLRPGAPGSGVTAVTAEQPGQDGDSKSGESAGATKVKSKGPSADDIKRRTAIVDDPASEAARSGKAKRILDKPAAATDVEAEASEGTATDKTDDAQSDENLAADGSALQLDSATADPEDTELFNVDIETAESAEDELPSAAERDIFNLGYATNRTSDDYVAHTYSFSYRNNRREWFWPWQEAASRGIDWGLDVERTKGDAGASEFTAVHGQGTLGFYLTKGSYLQAQVGRHKLETDSSDRSITSRHVTAMFGLNRSFSLQLETGRDFIYTGGSVTGGITRQLTSLDHTASFRWRPETRLRIQGQGGYRKYDETNEENIARHADISALYGVSTGWPWVWAGIGAKTLKYDEEVVDYWSPDRFTAYGLRFESSFPVYKRLAASASANLNRQSENSVAGYGYDVSGGFQYRLYGNLYARLDMSKSKSIQQSSTWKSDNITFSLSGPLF
jgi:hypothetical protein